MSKVSRFGNVALLALTASLLTNCTPSAPPALTDADLQSAMMMDSLGKEVRGVDLTAVASGENVCVDLHHGGSSLTDDMQQSEWRKFVIRLGIGGGLTKWQLPGPGDRGPVSPATEGRLAHASARAVLSANDRPAKQRRREWPKKCDSKYWFDAPVYEGKYAFIDQGTSCGDLCGAGSTLALEYRNGRWRVVGTRSTWMA